MAFKDRVRDLGNHLRFIPNTKGTGRPGIPSAIAVLSKTETAPATETPTKLTTTSSASKG